MASSPFYPQYDPPPSTSGGGYPLSQFNPYRSSRSERDQFEQWLSERERAEQEQIDWEREFGDLQDWYRGREGESIDRLQQLYGPIWGGGGGYTPEQFQQITREDELQRLLGQSDENYLKDWERDQINLNPWAGRDRFAERYSGLESSARQIGENLQGQVGASRAGGQELVDRLRSDYDRAIDPNALRRSGEYMGRTEGALSGGASRVREQLGDRDLELDPEYLRQAYVSDEEVDRLAYSGAADAGARYRSLMDQADREAYASGAASPLGIAGLRERMTRSGAAAMQDAQLAARLAGRGAQRDAAQRIQDSRGDLAKYRTGLGTSAELALQGRELDAANSAEQFRLSGERDLGDRYLRSAEGGADRGLDVNRYYAGLNYDAARTAGQMGLDVGMFGASNLAEMERYGESEASRRAADIAYNRQGTARGNQQLGLQGNEALASRYQSAYAPWLDAQREGRAAATGMMGYFGDRGQQTTGTRLSGRELGQRGVQGAVGGYGNWGSTGGQGFGDKLGSAVAAGLGQWASPSGVAAALGMPQVGGGGGRGGRYAHGGIVTSPEIALIGEAGPEAVVPLTPGPDRRRMMQKVHQFPTSSYRMNMGKHHQPNAMPYSEMGNLGAA